MKRPRTPVVVLSGLVLVLWAVLAWLVAPAVIASAYRGESLSFLNDALSGRTVHPLERYLAVWATLRIRVLVGLSVAAVFAISYSMAGAALAERLAPITGRIGGRNPVIVPLRHVLLYSLAFGAVGGLLEFAGVHVHSWYSGRPPWPSTAFAIWLTPAANILVLSLLLLVLSPLLVRAPRMRSVGVLVFALAFAVILAFLRVAAPVVHPAAAVFLAAGFAYRLAHAGVVRGPATDRGIVRSAPLLAGLVTVLFLGQQAATLIRERMALAGKTADNDAPNVLILLLDTVRARDLGLYGYDRETSPELEKIGADGVVFERAVATSSWSLPSHASLFTGRMHPELTGELTKTLDDTYPTLAEVLTAKGYRTGAFFANQLFGKRHFGLDRGFVHHETKPLSVQLIVQDSWILRGLVAQAGRVIDVSSLQVRESADEVNRRVLDWLGRDSSRPFFVFANYFDAHEPFTPPPPFDTLFWPVTPRGHYTGQGQLTEDERRELRAAYDGAIAYLDHEIGNLVRELEGRGLMRNTLLVVLSDHGEDFGGKGSMGHGVTLYMSSIRVPLLVRFPGRFATGRRVDEPVSLRSVPATVLEALGLDAAEAGLGGESLARFVRASEPVPDSPRQVVLSQLSPLTADTTGLPEWMPTRYGELRSIVWEDYHYILRGDGEEELYDLARDPQERVELSDSASAAGVLRMARMLMDSVLQAADRGS